MNPRLQSIFEWYTQQPHTTDHGKELENKADKITQNKKEGIISTTAMHTTYWSILKGCVTHILAVC